MTMTEKAENRHNTLRGIGLIILAMLVFAVMDGLTRFLVKHYSMGQILWVRYMVFPLFALCLCGGKVRQTIRSRRPWLQVLRGAVLLIESFFFVISFRYFPLAETHSIAASAPLMVTALAPLCLREHVGFQRCFAVLVGFAGTLIIIRPGFGTISWVVVWPIMAAMFFAILQIMTRVLGRADQSRTTLLYSAIVGFVIISGIGPFFWSAAPLCHLALMVLVGLLGATAHFLLIMALRYTHASVLQPYTYFLLVWAVLVGFVAFGELPDTWTLLGGAIVVASGLYAFHRKRTPTIIA